MATIMDYALAYRRKFNWSVIPVKDKGWTTIKWGKYQEQLPTEDEIKQWWSDDSATGIALITGKISGVIVWDCDSQDAIDWIENVDEGRGVENTLLCQSSYDYKRHYYFKYPDFKDDQEINSKNLRKMNVNLDIKSNGGYVLIPPTPNKIKTTYKWITPLNTPISNMDFWQLQLIDKLSRKYNQNSSHKPISSWALNTLSFGVGIGERDNAAFGLACEYAKRGFSKNDITQTLKQWNKQNKPPLTDRQIEKCIKSGIAKAGIRDF